LKIAIFSDSPQATTGFAIVADKIVDAAIKAGHEPVVVGMKLKTAPKEYKCKLYHPEEYGDKSGRDMLEKVVLENGCQVVVTAADPWNLAEIVQLREQIGFYWIGYTPVEGTPFPKKVKISFIPPVSIDLSKIIAAMDLPIAYTKFGATAISDMVRGLDVDVIPHGVDTDFFTPGDREKCKALIGLSKSDILFTVVKANNDRAGFEILLSAWWRYMKKGNNKKHFLYIHTDTTGCGYNLHDLFEQEYTPNVLFNESIKSGHGVPVEQLRDIYRATDVFINPAKAEGWGLNVSEAMACGIPCIVSDYGAPAEYVRDGAVVIPVAEYYKPIFSDTRFGLMDSKKLCHEMGRLARDSKKREAIGRRGRAVISEYSWQRFIDNWVCVFGSCPDVEISHIKWSYV